MKSATVLALVLAAAKPDGDVVVTGRIVAVGFSEQGEFAAVLIENMQKGNPATPLKVALDDAARKADCCVTGGRYKLHLKSRPDGLYGVVRVGD